MDGHTRRLAAIEAGVDVVVCFHDFRDEDEAMDYAIANQRDRRNLDDAELMSLVQAVDRRKRAGRPEKELASPDANFGRSDTQTAELTGTSPKKVSKIRAIADHAEKTGDSEEKDAVLAGTMSINRAERQVRAKVPRSASRIGRDPGRSAIGVVRIGDGPIATSSMGPPQPGGAHRPGPDAGSRVADNTSYVRPAYRAPALGNDDQLSSTAEGTHFRRPLVVLM